MAVDKEYLKILVIEQKRLNNLNVNRVNMIKHYTIHIKIVGIADSDQQQLHCHKTLRWIFNNEEPNYGVNLLKVVIKDFCIWIIWTILKLAPWRGCSSVVERSLCMWKARGSIPRISTSILECLIPIAVVAEWLRRWTWNPMGSARVGSNPANCAFFGENIFWDPLKNTCLLWGLNPRPPVYETGALPLS